jgi:hypothetical protein
MRIAIVVADLPVVKNPNNRNDWDTICLQPRFGVLKREHGRDNFEP